MGMDKALYELSCSNATFIQNSRPVHRGICIGTYHVHAALARENATRALVDMLEWSSLGQRISEGKERVIRPAKVRNLPVNEVKTDYCTVSKCASGV